MFLNRCKIPPTLMASWSIIRFAYHAFRWGRHMGGGTFPKYAAQLSYPSYFENTHTVGLYPTHNPKHQKARIKKWICSKDEHWAKLIASMCGQKSLMSEVSSQKGLDVSNIYLYIHIMHHSPDFMHTTSNE